MRTLLGGGAFVAVALFLMQVTSAAAFLGFTWGSSEAPWDICGHSNPELRCSCADDTIQAMMFGLDCRNRKIQALHDDMIIPLRFRTINLSANNLSDIHRDTFASNNSHVTGLDLSVNNLLRIPEETFANLCKLQRLDLSNNVIVEMNDLSLRGLPELVYFDLSYNQLTSLHAELFANNTKLEVLLLAYNSITVLPDALFFGLANLKKLDLTFLKLQTLHPDMFMHTARLEILDLGSNNLEQLPTKALFQLAPSLKRLDLSGNPIKVFPAYALYGLQWLEELRLEQLIHLQSIEAFAFDGLKSLRAVVLRYLPKIRFLDEKAFTSIINDTEIRSPIQDLTFSYTVIQNLPEHLLDWDQLKYLDLHNNRWKCDCNFAWVKGSRIENMTGQNFYCSSPPRLRGALLTWLQKQDFVCSPYDHETSKWEWALMSTIFLAGIVVSLATVATLFYRRNGFLCRKPANYNKLTAQSRDSITVVDDTNVVRGTDAEINL